MLQGSQVTSHNQIVSKQTDKKGVRNSKSVCLVINPVPFKYLAVIIHDLFLVIKKSFNAIFYERYVRK